MKKKAFLVMALVFLVGIAIHANASDPVKIYFEEIQDGVKCFLRNDSDKPRVVTMLRFTKKVNLNGGLAFPPIPLEPGETFCAGTFTDFFVEIKIIAKPVLKG